MTATDTAIVIVNFRTPLFTIEAVRSALLDSECTEVIIVENGSGDDSEAQIRAAFRSEPRVRIVVSSVNLGFGGGNNLGVRETEASLLFFLNSDATLTTGALATLISERQRIDTPAIVAPEIVDHDGGGVQRGSVGTFPTALRLLTQKTKTEPMSDDPDWVTGCAMLIDRSLFQQAGGFDPDLFMYFEDILLCRRVRDLGGFVRVCRSARVRHRGGQSYSSEKSKKIDYYQAQDTYLRKVGTPAPLRAAVRSLRRIGRRI
jgi:GT2 family glycosyltransferase